MLLIPGTSKYKQYFALLGTFEQQRHWLTHSLIPTISTRDHFVLHYWTCCPFLGNALLYLFRNYQPSLLNLKNGGDYFRLKWLDMGCQLSCRWRLWILNKPPLVGSFTALKLSPCFDCYRDSNSLNRKLVENFLQQNRKNLFKRRFKMIFSFLDFKKQKEIER